VNPTVPPSGPLDFVAMILGLGRPTRRDVNVRAAVVWFLPLAMALVIWAQDHTFFDPLSRTTVTTARSRRQ
jgi:hypothetical protein